ncbi:MAG: hypothetical protein E2O61_15585 [Gammaproteobacteria bacterium]|nr:MAG: hypothetical protein E2O59_01970 [Gammaproteobacteria bacterium]TDJ31554.1 MAG: hypothetical protein E2O61_15585 [Gammaproteobacteria bacterium]
MSEETGQAKVIYVLYLAGFIVGVTPLIGVVMAYLAKGEAPEWLDTHYRYQIRTFWIGFLYTFVSVLLTVILIGILGLLATAVWLIVRCIKGFQALDRGEPIEKVATWMF